MANLFANQRKILLRVFTIAAVMQKALSQVTLHPSSTNTGTGNDTQIQDIANTFTTYNDTVYIVSTMYSSTYMYDVYGNRLMKYVDSFSNNATDLVTIEGTDKVFAVFSQQTCVLVTLAYSSTLNLYTIASFTILQQTAKTLGISHVTNTSYVLTSFYMNNRNMSKIDTQASVTVVSSRIVAYNNTDYSIDIQYIDNTVTTGSSIGYIYYIDISNLHILKYILFNTYIHRLIYDIHTNTKCYILFTNGYLAYTDVVHSVIGNPIQVYSKYIGTMYSYNAMLNLGQYQYLLLTSANSDSIALVSKYTLDITYTYKVNTILKYSLCNKVLLLNDMFYFAYVESANKNFQSYYLLFDKCTHRTAAGVCEGCITGAYRDSLDASNNKCFNMNEIPSGWGVVASSNTPLISNCSSSGCLDCKVSHLQCVLCNVASGFYLYIINNSCHDVSSMPLGFGRNISSNFVEKCQDSDCVACANDNTKCTLCNQTSGFYLNESSFQCVSFDSIPPGFGVEISNLTLQRCVDPHCLLCKADVSNCTGCDTDQEFYLRESTQNCVSKAALNSGYGPFLANGTVQRCLDSNCLKCSDSISICASCNITAGFYLLPSNSSCLSNDQIPQEMGINVKSGTVDNCAVSGCSNCSLNYLVCSSCGSSQTGNSVRCLNQATQSCTDSTQLPAKLGCSPTTWLAEQCQDRLCQNCSIDSGKCLQCDWTISTHMSGGLCKSAVDVPPRQGPNTQTHILVTCADSNCRNCSKNYQICTECDQQNGYYLEDNVCKSSAARKLYLVRTILQPIPTMISFYFSESIEVNFNSLGISLDDDQGSSYSGSTSLAYYKTDKGFNVKIVIPKIIQRASLSINRSESVSSNRLLESVPRMLSSSNSAPAIKSADDPNLIFTAFPIHIQNFKVLNDPSLVKAAESLNQTFEAANTARATATVLFVTSNPSLAIFLDKMFCDFTYLSLLGSQNQSYPMSIFRMVSKSKIVPFELLNVASNFVYDPECIPTYEFDQQGFQCNFLANYGEDFTVIVVTLVINLIMTGIFLIFMNYLPDEDVSLNNLWLRLLFSASKSFGLRYFFLKMEGNILEASAFSFNNFRNIAKTGNVPGMVVGSVISFLVLAYYLGYFYMVYRSTRHLQESVKRKNYTTQEENPLEIQDAFLLKKIKFSMVSFNFDGLRYPISVSYLIYPLVATLRSFLVSFCLVFLSETRFVQLSVLFLVELSFFIYALKTRVKASTFEHVCERVVNFLHMTYIIFSGMSYTSLAEDDPNNFVGIGMTCILLLILLVDAVFVITEMIKSLIECISNMNCTIFIVHWMKGGLKAALKALSANGAKLRGREDRNDRNLNNSVSNESSHQSLNRSKRAALAHAYLDSEQSGDLNPNREGQNIEFKRSIPASALYYIPASEMVSANKIEIKEGKIQDGKLSDDSESIYWKAELSEGWDQSQKQSSKKDHHKITTDTDIYRGPVLGTTDTTLNSPGVRSPNAVISPQYSSRYRSNFMFSEEVDNRGIRLQPVEENSFRYSQNENRDDNWRQRAVTPFSLTSEEQHETKDNFERKQRGDHQTHTYQPYETQQPPVVDYNMVELGMATAMQTEGENYNEEDMEECSPGALDNAISKHPSGHESGSIQ